MTERQQKLFEALNGQDLAACLDGVRPFGAHVSDGVVGAYPQRIDQIAGQQNSSSAEALINIPNVQQQS